MSLFWLDALPGDGWAPFAALSSPKPPAPPPPQPMPDLQDPTVLLARQKALEATMARSGRISTVLSDTGGDTYGNSKLGLR